MSYDKLGRKFLKGLRDYRVAPDFTTQAIGTYLSSLDCPRSLAVWLLFKSGEHDQLVDLECNPLHYNNVEHFRDSYAATEFLSKYKKLSLSSDPKTVAVAKFKKFELACRSTNLRFKNLALDPLFKGSNVWLHSAITRKIERLLGEFSFDEFVSRPDWGPGASTLIRRRDASSQEKFQCETGITRALYSFLPVDLLWEVYPSWAVQLLDAGFPHLEPGAKVITVPKSAKTDRVIAVEPGLNLWFQMSIGNMIKTRLKRVGISTTDQGINQRFARYGSKTGAVATVDLSSASDSISREVVEALLPPRWFRVMDLCRSPCGVLDGEVIWWEKFSSMGNGFTFPLQTLIFYAIAFCCTEFLREDVSFVSAYGDDVIVPTSVFQLFSEVLGFYGFVVNKDKSHFDSPFRESCGAHYFSGCDVKPIYLKDKLSSILSIFRLANAVRRQAHNRNEIYGCDSRLFPAFDLLFRKVPSALRLVIPEGFGDGGFIGNLDEATPRRARHGIEGFRFMHATDVGSTHIDDRLGYLLAELWRLENPVRDNKDVQHYSLLNETVKKPHTLKAIDEALVNLTDRGSKTRKARRNTVPNHEINIGLVKSVCRQWSDLGPWL